MTPRAHGTGCLVRLRLTVIVIAGITSGTAARPAHAQWYGGGFWGNPWSGPPASVDFLNQAAIQRIGSGGGGSNQPTSLQGVTQGYRTSDPEFFERYDIETRRAMEDRVARNPSRPVARATPAAKPAATPAPELVKPFLPIASFFNASKQLVWPSDAPADGDLGSKRRVSDLACLAVKEDTSKGSAAPIAAVTEARTKLLDYGRPALDYLRNHSTPPVAELFHMFLLSLYDSLGQAATPRAASGS